MLNLKFENFSINSPSNICIRVPKLVDKCLPFGASKTDSRDILVHIYNILYGN